MNSPFFLAINSFDIYCYYIRRKKAANYIHTVFVIILVLYNNYYIYCCFHKIKVG